MKSTIKTLILILLGAAAGLVLMWFYQGSGLQGGEGMAEAAPAKPLYWAAPMDPDYRRDSPGKSPMGMDLLPVYASDRGGAGIVEIAPEVVNNLGVRTVSVAYARLQPNIRTVGYVQYDQDRLVHIHPRVDGWIEKLYVKAAGDPVEKGQPLYALYSPQLVGAQEELLLALARGNEPLVRAARNRLLALQLGEAFIEQLKRERKVQQTVIFRAPQDGVVDNLNIREGFYVAPNTTLMSIAALDEVWVEAEVFERQAASVKVGLPVSMTLEYLPGQQWQGTVDYVYPSLDEKTRTLRVRLRFANQRGDLRPNMYAQVKIHTDGGEPALLVPQEALIRTASQERVVIALGEGRFKSVLVESGRRDSASVEILGGLSEGDTVVVSAQFLLDSESSRTSGFLRLTPPPESDASAGMTMPEDALPPMEHDHD